MSFKKNPKNMKNEREEPPLKADKASGFRPWRSRRMPVQLVDFLVSDIEKAAQSGGDSAVSNVSPVVSASSSRNTPKRVASEPKTVCFEPNDDEFPAVGTIRTKKAKTAPSSIVVEPPIAPVAPMVIPEEEAEVSQPKRAEKYGNNQKTVNKWLESVQQPEMQSQQLPAAPPQLVTQQAPLSAPAIVNAVPQVSQASHVPQSIRPIPCAPTQRSYTASAGAGNVRRSAPFTPTNRPAPSLPRTSGDVHSAPLYAVVPQSGRPIMRTLSTSSAHDTRIGAPSGSADSLITGPNRRFQERRQRREQYSLDGSISAARSGANLPPQLSDELMLQQDHVPSSGRSEHASFVRELQQAVASNYPPTDIVSQSTLNWNAVEFQPRSLSPPPPSDDPLKAQVAARYLDTRYSITERRRRQRFNRTLKPGAMFELLEMPSDSQEAPAVISPRATSNQFAVPSSNNVVNQSVFRLTSLPLTGIGTDKGQVGETGLDISHNQTLSTISGPGDSLPCETRRARVLEYLTREMDIMRGVELDLDDQDEEDEDNSSCLSGETFDILEGEEEDPSLCLSARTFDIPVEEEDEHQELNNQMCQMEVQRDLLRQSMLMYNISVEPLNPICPTEQSIATFKAGDSPPLLDMDPSIHQANASPFLTPECKTNAMHSETGPIGAAPVADVSSSSHNKSSQPPYMLFLKGNAARHNVEPDLNFMPMGIKKLYNVICSKYSDYAFVYTLSAQLGQGVMPMECYVYLKMALLVSLASIDPDEQRTPISLCVICTDSCVTSRLMKSVGFLAPRFLGPHEGGQLPSFSGLPPRNNWIQASPLMLAQQGVYFVGDWSCLSRDQAEELEKSMENNSLIVPQQQTEQPLLTAIWTYWQPENATKQTEAFAKLCPIFGMPVYMDAVENDALWDFVLRGHHREGHNPLKDAMHIPTDDLISLLELVQQRKVVFTKPAEHLLKKYYIVSRVLHPTAFSSKTYVVLKQFAESITKLALRLDVLESDVVVAIFHCENFVRNIFGVGEFPPPSISNFNIISHVDPYMNIFTRWLFQYLERFEDKAV